MKFVKKFGDFLTSPIILKVPSGKSWQVELLKVGDEIWVANGWHEFSEHHSLKYGHLVLFKYEGGCHFNVHIFDMSAVEIKYPGSEIPSSVDPNDGGCFQQRKLQVNEDADAISCGNEDQDDISCEELDCTEGNEDQEDSYCEILDDSTSNGNQPSDDSHVSLEESEGKHSSHTDRNQKCCDF